MASKKIILIFGATGNQGGAIVKTFLNDPKLKDWAIRGVTRNVESESAKKLSAQGVEMVSANMDDKSTLVAAMTGVYAVFAMTDYWAKMDDKLEIAQGKALADAAKETGVQHFIFSSLMNVNKLTNGKLAHVYHFDSKAAVEEYTREIGIPATFFMPGFFMSNIPGQMLRPMPPNNDWTLALPMSPQAPIPLFASERDSGIFIKAIVLNREKLLGEQVYAATSYVTPEEIVGAFKANFPEAGKTASFFQAPDDMFLGAMTGSGLPEFAAREMLENMQLMDNGGYYGGKSLDSSLALLDPADKPTTWVDYAKTAKGFAGLK